jgi:hypothetical protein
MSRWEQYVNCRIASRFARTSARRSRRPGHVYSPILQTTPVVFPGSRS